MDTRLRPLGLMILLSLLLSGHSLASASDPRQLPIRLVADEWCPQHCKSDGPDKGYIVEIVEQALNEEKLPFTLTYNPWIRALRSTENGIFDGLLTPTIEHFDQFLFHKETLGYQQYCFYVNKDSTWQYTQPRDLLGKNIAYLKESGLGELDGFLAEHRKEITAQEFVGAEGFTRTIFPFLARHRTEAVIITSDVYSYALKNHKIDDSFKTAGCLAQEKLAVGFSTLNRERAQWLADSLDNGIRKLQKNGKLKLILDKYGLAQP